MSRNSRPSCFTSLHPVDSRFTVLCTSQLSMIRWINPVERLGISKGRPALFAWTAVQRGRHQTRFATSSAGTQRAEPRSRPPEYGVFRSIPIPEQDERRNPEAWMKLLEASLPPDLRQESSIPSSATLDATDTAEILLAAQGSVRSSGVDLLYYVGMVQGRWRAVVWLVKHLVENFATSRPKADRLSQIIWPWSNEGTLEDITSSPVDLQPPERHAVAARLKTAVPMTLYELTDDLKPENMGRTEILQRDVLGQVWRSLGAMIAACTDGVVKPEILEIIAYLHHSEVMPTSIYSQKPGMDETAIQQPPTLHILSSRILTSLSDAAWRAHERVVVEEAKAKGGQYVALRPEIPGMAYRVHVAGLRPEIWLELVLWSCLHGGWVLEGAAVLRQVSRQTPEWKPLSWRSLMPMEKTGLPDWDKLEYMFNTRSPATMDPPDGPNLDVVQTVSSEVVNAYVDALLSMVDVGVGERGAPPKYILRQLNLLKDFLARSNLKLGGGSWDAVILRFLESQAGHAMQLRDLQSLARLTPGFGHEVEATNTRSLPTYVLDGSAAFVGLCHRVLHSFINAGSIEGALRAFKVLQDHTDANKRQSLEDFFQTIRQAQGGEGTGDEAGHFTSNYSRIHYPAFDLQIPTTTLGPFLELVTDSGAYELGSWLLRSEEIDGPLIPERLYNDGAIAPALVKFATKTNDRELLLRVIDLRAQQNTQTAQGPTLPSSVAQSFLDSQFALQRWDAATRILEYMRGTPFVGWNIVNLSVLARNMLALRQGVVSGKSDCERDLTCAEEIFADMVKGRYSKVHEKRQYKTDQVSVLLTILSATDAYWANFCLGLQQMRGHFDFKLATKSFNVVLEGFVEAYGSASARRLLGLFWSHTTRKAQTSARRSSGGRYGTPKMPRFRQTQLDSADRQRTLIHLPGQERKHVVIYGGLQPDLTTIRVIFRQAIKEIKQRRAQNNEVTEESMLDENEVPFEAEVSVAPVDEKGVDNSPLGMIVWAVRCLRALDMADEDIRSELNDTLSVEELRNIESQLPKLFDLAENEDDAELDKPTFV